MSLARDSILVLISNASNSASRLFFYFTLNRFYSDVIISEIIVLLTLIEVLAVILDLGVNKTHMMQKAHSLENVDILTSRKIRSVLSISVLITISLINSSTIYLITLSILSYNYLLNYYLKNLLFERYFWINLFCSIFLIIVCSFNYISELSIWVLLVGYFGGKLFSVIWEWKIFQYNSRFLIDGFQGLIHYRKNLKAIKNSSIYFTHSSSTTLLRKGDLFYLNHFSSSPLEVKSLGLFFTFTAFFPLISGAIRNSLLPKSLEDRNLSNYISRYKIKILSLFIVIGVSMSMILKFPFSVFYDITDQEILTYFIIICVATAVNSTSTFFQIPLLTKGENSFILKVSITQLIVQAALSIILVPNLGLLGSVLIFLIIRLISIIAYGIKI